MQLHSPLRHLNGARFRFFHLWQCEGKDAVLQLGGDPTLINLARKLEAAGVMPDVVFDIEWLETLVFREVQPAYDAEDISCTRTSTLLFSTPGISRMTLRVSGVS